MKPSIKISLIYTEGDDFVHIFIYPMPQPAVTSVGDTTLPIEQWKALHGQLTAGNYRLPTLTGPHCEEFETFHLKLTIEYRTDIPL